MWSPLLQKYFVIQSESKNRIFANEVNKIVLVPKIALAEPKNGFLVFLNIHCQAEKKFQRYDASNLFGHENVVMIVKVVAQSISVQKDLLSIRSSQSLFEIKKTKSFEIMT